MFSDDEVRRLREAHRKITVVPGAELVDEACGASFFNVFGRSATPAETLLVREALRPFFSQSR